MCFPVYSVEMFNFILSPQTHAHIRCRPKVVFVRISHEWRIVDERNGKKEDVNVDFIQRPERIIKNNADIFIRHNENVRNLWEKLIS